MAIAAEKALFTLDHSNSTADTEIYALSQVQVNCVLDFPDSNCCKALFTLDHSNSTADTDIAEIAISQVQVNSVLDFPDGNCCRQGVVHLGPFQFYS